MVKDSSNCTQREAGRMEEDMSLQLFEAIDLGHMGEAIRAAESTVLGLLDQRSEVEDRLEEVQMLELVSDRLEQQACLWDETIVFLARCKAMVDTIKNASDRVSEAKEKIESAVMKEVDRFENGKTTSATHKFAIKGKPAVILVKDLAAVPKKYRLVPKPIPEWEEWPVDKNMAKQALTKEKVGKINGLELDESGKRIEIKPR